MNVPIKKLPPGPHKNWAIYLRDILEELGWTREKTCTQLGVDIGWLKKAVGGFDLDGGFRNTFQKRLEEKWDDYRKDKLRIGPIEWPPYVENAPWDKNRPLGSLGGTAQFIDSANTIKKLLEECQTALEKIPPPKEDAAEAKFLDVQKPGHDLQEKILFEAVCKWIDYENPIFQKQFLSAAECLVSKNFKKAGKLFFQLGREIIHLGNNDKLKYREYAFSAIDVFFFAVITLVGGKCYEQTETLLKRQIEYAQNNGDMLVVAKLKTLLSVSYHQIDVATNSRSTEKYAKLGLAAAQSALAHLSPHNFPSEWAEAQLAVADNLFKLSGFSDGKSALVILKEAEAVAHSALSVSGPETIYYPYLSVILGKTIAAEYYFLEQLGMMEEATQILELLTKLSDRAIKNISPEQFPMQWAKLQSLYGSALMFSIGKIIHGRQLNAPEMKDAIRVLSKSINAFKYGLGVFPTTDARPVSEIESEIGELVVSAKAIYDYLKTGDGDTTLLELVAGYKKPAQSKQQKQTILAI